MIDLWYRGRMYKHLLGSLSGLLIALLVQGCCEEDPEVDFCSIENMPSSELWGLCTVDEQCPVGSACRSNVCSPRCSEDADCGDSGFCSMIEPRVCILPCADYPQEVYEHATCTEVEWAAGEPTSLDVDTCGHCGPLYCRWYYEHSWTGND